MSRSGLCWLAEPPLDAPCSKPLAATRPAVWRASSFVRSHSKRPPTNCIGRLLHWPRRPDVTTCRTITVLSVYAYLHWQGFLTPGCPTVSACIPVLIFPARQATVAILPSRVHCRETPYRVGTRSSSRQHGLQYNERRTRPIHDLRTSVLH